MSDLIDDMQSKEMVPLASLLLPYEILCEIARRDWRAWGHLRVCNWHLFGALARDDPYALFTTQVVIDPCLDEIWVSWRTRDEIDIRRVVRSQCGFIVVQYRDGRALYYDYEMTVAPSTIPGRRIDLMSTTYYCEHHTGIVGLGGIRALILWHYDYLDKRREAITEAQFNDIQRRYSIERLLGKN